jgi:hypothetical protein
MTTLATGLQELTADEIDSVAGALQLRFETGGLKFHLSMTDHGITGSVKVGDGKWHGGTIWYDDLPK